MIDVSRVFLARKVARMSAVSVSIYLQLLLHYSHAGQTILQYYIRASLSLIGSTGAAKQEHPTPRALSVVGMYCWSDYDRSTTLMAGAYACWSLCNADSDDVVFFSIWFTA